MLALSANELIDNCIIERINQLNLLIMLQPLENKDLVTSIQYLLHKFFSHINEWNIVWYPFDEFLVLFQLKVI